MSDKRAKFSTFEQRVDWLVRNDFIWIKWWKDHSVGLGFYLGKKNFWSYLIYKMKQAKLYSKKTYCLDVKLKDEMTAAAKILRIKK
jgi:hypothetical protein